MDIEKQKNIASLYETYHEILVVQHAIPAWLRLLDIIITPLEVVLNQ